MKDSIDSRSILNRKIALEIRYLPNPEFEDKKGAIINRVVDLGCFKQGYRWKFNLGAVQFWDVKNEIEAREQLLVTTNKIGFISSNISSNEAYSTKVNKIVKEVLALIDSNVAVQRIGCRIIGTYNKGSKTFSEIKDCFLDIFPKNFLLEDFEPRDLKFALRYKNGIYTIGPVEESDNFILEHFPYGGADHSEGFGIDTDNFTASEEGNLRLRQINDVLRASFSVEKKLFENLVDSITRR